MRRLLPALAAVLVCSPAAAHARPPEDWKPGVRQARAYATGRAGLISFGIRTERRFDGLAPDMAFPSASVVKAMLLVAYLRDANVRARPLRPADRRMLTPMVRWSSNDAATAVRNIVGDDALARLARRAAMQRFATAPSWGSWQITARDQTRFF